MALRFTPYLCPEGRSLSHSLALAHISLVPRYPRQVSASTAHFPRQCHCDAGITKKSCLFWALAPPPSRSQSIHGPSMSLKNSVVSPLRVVEGDNRVDRLAQLASTQRGGEGGRGGGDFAAINKNGSMVVLIWWDLIHFMAVWFEEVP